MITPPALKWCGARAERCPADHTHLEQRIRGASEAIAADQRRLVGWGTGYLGLARATVIDRRRVGLVVIGLAVLLVAVVAGLRPQLVTGAAQSTPIQRPPGVGDCVVNPLPAPKLGVVAPVTADSGGTVPVYPAQQIQPCTGARYGEITAVIAAPKPTVVTGDDADGRFLNDPNESNCFVAAQQYLGMTTPPTQTFWQGRILQFSVALSRPSPRQQAAGQRWAACIVTLPPPDPASPPSRYGNSIRNAVHTGRYRDQLGSCIPNFDWDGGLAMCSQPHVLELMGWATVVIIWSPAYRWSAAASR